MNIGKYENTPAISAFEELQISEIRYRRLFESTRDGILILDAETRKITDVNPFMLELMGYPREYFLGKELWEIGLVKDEEASVAAFRELQENHYIRYENLPLENKNGEKWEVEVVSNVYTENNRQVVQCNIRDITERVKSEGKLKQLNLKIEQQGAAFNTLLSSITDMTFTFDPELRFSYANQAVQDLYGKKSEELLGKNFFDLNIAEDLSAPLRQNLQKVFDNGKSIKGETQFPDAAGEIGSYEYIFNPVISADGKVESAVGSAREITERKRAEEKLRQSETNLAAAQRITHLGSWEVQLSDLRRINTNKVHWSDEVYRIFGYQPEQIEVSINRYFNSIHPDDRKYCRRAFVELITGKKDLNIEFRISLPNGGERILHGLAEVIYDRQMNKPQKIIGTVQDITDRKIAEEALKQSERDYRTVFEQAHDAIIIFAPEGEIVLDVNRRACEIYGFSCAEFIGMSIETISKIPSNDKDKVKEILEAGEYLNFETVQLRKDGSEMSLEVNASTITYQGRQAIITINRDITERKRQAASLALSNDLLKQSEESYRIVAETASDVIITIDEFSTILFVNPAAEKVLGYKPEELTGSNLSVLVPERLQAAHRAGMSRYLQTGERGIPWSGVELQAVRRDGREIQIEISFGEYRESNKRLFTGIIRDISERKHAEEALRKAETRYRNLVELSPAVVYLAQPYPPYSPIYVSPNVKMFGYQSEEWLSRDDMWLSIIHKEDRARVLRITENAMSQNLDTEIEYRILGQNGEIYWVHDKGSFISDEQGEKIGWQGIILDITKTQALEEQLRQSQKLESVGLLAGGIAHDFNNMLTAINGYSSLTLRRLKEDDPLRRNIEEIKKAGERSADLTQQLLAFSRQQVLQPVVLDLNKVILDTIEMLQRVIDEDIQIITVLNPKVGRVKVDPGQFSQIILNLAVNARDAMPRGGKLIIETVNIFLDPDYAEQRAAVLPGAYVMLAVSDTGTGISAETKEHIFEPFFTTKEVGQGTGLGLATVYGIVKQSGGIIEVESEQGSGTTFKIYLPRVSEEASRIDVKDIPAEMPRGTETILLVEDEEMVRNLSREILKECGYTVIEAINGIEALELCGKGDCKFNLLMTDVVMPKMGGRELADLLKEKLPDLPVLFTSGYTDDAVVRHGVIEPDTNFIQKPFTPDLLAKKIRELLDSSEKSVHKR